VKGRFAGRKRGGKVLETPLFVVQEVPIAHDRRDQVDREGVSRKNFSGEERNKMGIAGECRRVGSWRDLGVDCAEFKSLGLEYPAMKSGSGKRKKGVQERFCRSAGGKGLPQEI